MVSPTTPDISITALHDPVAIVHIPIHLAERCSTRLYWTVDNARGLSSEFFNVTSNVVEIAVFARTDLINTYWTDISEDIDEIRISSTWRVFEISSGDQGETNNYDSPHLRHVSAPLSKAGIAILYQSSYFTDFLLVKESNFNQASEIFARQGWHVDPTVPSSRRRSQVLSPISPVSRSSVSPVTRPPTPELTVLPSPLACVGFSHTIERATAERIRQLVVWPEQARNSWRRKQLSASASPPPSRLDPENGQSRQGAERPFLSYTRTEDGASIVTETRILRWMFGRKPDRSATRGEWSEAEETGFASPVDETEFLLGGQLAVGYVTDTTDLDASTDEEEDDCQEGSPMSQSVALGEGRAEGRRRRDQGERSLEALQTPPPESHLRTKHLSLPTGPHDPLAPGSTLPIAWTRSSARRSTPPPKGYDPDTRGGFERRSSRGSRTGARSDTEHEDEGPGRGRRPRKTKPRVGRKRCLQLDLRGIGDEVDAPRAANRGEASDHAKRRGAEVYHMDKSGLVTLFSDLLDRGSIRMLYSSTFNTANILVEAGDVHRARRLLQGRSGSPVKVDPEQ